MAAPNLGNFTLHSYAKVSAATPPVVTSPVNIGALSVTRTGAGIWVVNLGTEIDFTQRTVIITPNTAAHASFGLDPAVQTDSTIGILGFVLAIASDVAFEVAVYRTSIPA